MPTDPFPEIMRTDRFSYEAAIPRLYTDVAETLFRTTLRAWPTTKIQAIACDKDDYCCGYATVFSLLEQLLINLLHEPCGFVFLGSPISLPNAFRAFIHLR